VDEHRVQIAAMKAFKGPHGNLELIKLLSDAVSAQLLVLDNRLAGLHFLYHA
jgi:hypothetical protein